MSGKKEKTVLNTERQQCESPGKYRDMVGGNSVFMWEAYPEWKYTYVSSGVKSILGYEVNEVIGKHLFNFVTKKDSENIKSIFKESTANRKCIKLLEDVNAHKDGHIIVLETNADPFFNESGQLAGYREISRDISESKRVEGELRISLAQMRRILEYSQDGIIIADSGGIVLHVNEAATFLIGHKKNEILGHPIGLPIDKNKVIEIDITRIKDEFGELGKAELYTTGVDWEGKDAYLLMIHDITDRKRLEKTLRESMESFNNIVLRSADAIIVTDLDGKIEFASPSAEEFFNCKEGLLVGEMFGLPVTGECLAEIDILRPGKKPGVGDMRVVKTQWLGKNALLVMIRDITERKKIEENLRSAHMQIQRIIDNNQDGIIIVDKDGIVLELNEISLFFFNRRKDDILGHPFRLSVDLDKAIEIDITSVRNFGKPGKAELHASEIVWEGKEAYMLMAHDITERKKAEEAVKQKSKQLRKAKKELSVLALQDSLTGLPNRRYFTDSISRAASASKRHKKKFALLIIDVDDFKHINDSLGHGMGDAVLKKLSLLLKRSIRREDIAARIVGDEFAVILTEIDKYENAVLVAHKILNMLQSPIHVKSTAIQVSVSIGVSCYPLSADSVDLLLRQADMAMYKAKNKGKNCVEVYTKETEAVRKI